jgi:hypothetical protein
VSSKLAGSSVPGDATGRVKSSRSSESASCAAESHIRRAEQEGHAPRHLHEQEIGWRHKKPRERAIVDALCNIGDVGLRGRWRFVDAHGRRFTLLLEDGVGGDRVEMDVQIEAATESLGR